MDKKLIQTFLIEGIEGCIVENTLFDGNKPKSFLSGFIRVEAKVFDAMNDNAYEHGIQNCGLKGAEITYLGDGKHAGITDYFSPVQDGKQYTYIGFEHSKNICLVLGLALNLPYALKHAREWIEQINNFKELQELKECQNAFRLVPHYADTTILLGA